VTNVYLNVHERRRFNLMKKIFIRFVTKKIYSLSINQSLHQLPFCQICTKICPWQGEPSYLRSAGALHRSDAMRPNESYVPVMVVQDSYPSFLSCIDGYISGKIYKMLWVVKGIFNNGSDPMNIF